MTKSARDKLGKFGISIGLSDSGCVELTSQSGFICTLSSRVYCPVIGFGADGRILVRLAGKGFAQFRIDGEQFEYRADDASRRMKVA